MKPHARADDGGPPATSAQVEQGAAGGDAALDDPPASDLAATFRALLSSTCQAASLLTLDLQVAGHPELAACVQRPAGPAEEIVVWVTSRPPCAVHGGLVLAASARDADDDRRAVVEHTATVIGELLTAELRAAHAETAARQALELAGVDPLTQVGNRRTWQRALEDEARRSARYGTPTTVVVVDLDGLKRINDEHGHAAGDAYLQRVAGAVRAAARSVDVVCRLGGDEFGLLAPQTDAAGAERLVTRLRAALADADVDASVGIATAGDGALEQAWQSADAAMYDDKRSRAVR